MARDFQDFLQRLEAAGELKRVGVEVDPFLEAGAIADRVSKADDGGPALRFDQVKGTGMPVIMNAFGSYRRMCMALGVDKDPRGLDAVADRIEKLIQEAMPKPGSSFLDKLAKLPMLAEVSAWMPKTVKKALCQEVVLRGEDAKLSMLPVLTTWPEDGGPFITLGLSHTRFKDGRRNMGLYRLQVFDDHTLGFHTQLHHDGARARHGYQDGERMPVAVSFGGDPALTYAATAPLPPFLSEIMFTGFLRGEGVEMVKCVTHDLEVPADSELVIEGWVDPAEVTTPCCTWRPSPIAANRCTRPPSWAGPRRRTSTWAWPPNGSSCRCCAWSCPKWWTCTCRRPEASTTSSSFPSARPSRAIPRRS